jgi:hypothetical protein
LADSSQAAKAVAGRIVVLCAALFVPAANRLDHRESEPERQDEAAACLAHVCPLSS